MGKKPDDHTEPSGQRRPGGRAAEVVAAVHTATVALLEEQGYERMEIPAIAERAGVNKTSIYRRWPGKAELVLDVALVRIRAEVPLPDTGTLQGDLTALMRAIAAANATPFAGGLLRALISREGEAGVAELRERFWNERYSISGEVLRRAIARGDLPAATDHRLMLEMAVAPLFLRALVIGTAITEAEIEAIAGRVIKAFHATRRQKV
jgi:AcrR family transcriptional regulator